MTDRNQLHPVSESGGSVDQVPRLEAFRRDHPGVSILSPRQLGGRDWLATWDEEAGSTTITRWELRSLLDALDKRFGAGEQQLSRCYILGVGMRGTAR
jgi:hypothetical protein